MDTSGISDEAVRSAARAMYDLENQGRSALAFAMLPEWEVEIRNAHARAALEAAAPHMLADAEGAGYNRAIADMIAFRQTSGRPRPYMYQDAAANHEA